MAGPGGTIFLGADDNTFPGKGDSNSGDETVYGEGGADNIFGGIGSDVLDGGIGNDELFGEEGNDLLIGGEDNDHIEGGEGNDGIWDFTGTLCQIDGGGGDDYIQLGSSFGQLSTVNGGDGFDTIQTTAALSLELIFVSSIEGLETFGARVTASAAQFNGFSNIMSSGENPGGPISLGLPGLRGLPNLVNLSSQLQDRGCVFFGSAGRDRITLGGGNDAIYGSGGGDRLDGRGGNDVLNGGSGNDLLTGGLGHDDMRAGAGFDVFDFNAAAESVKGPERDVIVNFVSGTDKIDLSTIDAIAGGADDPFAYIGGAGFHQVAGELRVEVQAARTIIAADIDGNGKADFEIALKPATAVLETDFVL